MDHALFDELPEHQQLLIDIIGQQWAKSGRWPVYDYIDRQFRAKTGANTLATMTDLPFAPVGHDSYFMVFSEDGQRWGNPDRRTGLTIAGTSHLPYLRTQVEQLVTAIGAIASEDARLTPDPDLAVRLDLDVQEVILLLGPILATWKPTDLASVLDLGKR